MITIKLLFKVPLTTCCGLCRLRNIRQKARPVYERQKQRRTYRVYRIGNSYNCRYPIGCCNKIIYIME